MAKPWGRLEQGYVRHPKFIALSDGAFRLWHEGKNYCDEFLTDGKIPRNALRGFPSRTRARVAELTRSCGLKPDGSPYAPLWQEHVDTGHLQMHDYLDHNDCHDAVRARMAKADEKREKDAARLRTYRERAARVVDTHADTLLETPVVTPCDTPSDTPDVAGKQKQKQKHLQEEQEIARVHGGGVLAGSLPRDHAEHVFCDFAHCVPRQLHAKLTGLLAPRYRGSREQADDALRAWYPKVVAALPADFVMGDAFKFWTARFDKQLASKDDHPSASGRPVPNIEQTRAWMHDALGVDA